MFNWVLNMSPRYKLDNSRKPYSFSPCHLSEHNYHEQVSLDKKFSFPLRINFLSKCDQSRRKLRIWSHILKRQILK